MLENDPIETPATAAAGDTVDTPAPPKVTTRKRTTKKAAAKTASAPESVTADAPVADEPAAEAPPKKKSAPRKTAKKATRSAAAEAPSESATEVTVDSTASPETDQTTDQSAGKPKKATAKKTTARKTTAKKSSAEKASAPTDDAPEAPAEAAERAAAATGAAPLFKAPEVTTQPRRRAPKKKVDEAPADEPTNTSTQSDEATADTSDESAENQSDQSSDDESSDGGEGTGGRRRRRRGGRRRRKPGDGESAGDEQGEASDSDEKSGEADENDPDGDGDSLSSRRRRRRRRAGDEGGDGGDDPANTVTRVRKGRNAADEITAVSGSTRLEAKKQRRREGREAGRRRAPIVSEAEFLARRESVKRVMVIRQHGDITQIGVLEDNVLVEHYVARESQTSLIGNVYLGRVQNVLPSMEAAFIDIGKGRNAVLYAGEVNWSQLGHKEGQPRKIESVLSSGQSVLVQVTKDPIGHKGARLTSQVSLAGRFLVYVPDGTTSGISRKLPDTERNRLKALLKEIVPETAGVIVRTAAEGAAEDELTRDVERLTARWDDIEKKAANKGAGAQLLYGEPDLTLKVVRDLFTEDFATLVIEGDDAWDTVQGYVEHVAPDLQDRLQRYQPKNGQDVFSAYRIDEQIKKGLDRKVWLPSGGSLVIDRTEAMTVVDVNTGKFTGSGGNLEETVTKNNLEAAEEIIRQLRLRDIGGIIVVDFIDMVLESNRDLVLRRMVECLGRDRTRHQVAEVTSLGLVQMTRKRIGTGLLESFSHDCSACNGRGVVIEEAPVEPRKSEDEPRRSPRRSRGGKGRDGGGDNDASNNGGDNGVANGRGRPFAPSPKDLAAAPRHEHEHHDHDDPTRSAEDSPVAEAVESVETEMTDASVQTPAAPETESTVAQPAKIPSEPAPVTTEPEAPQAPAADDSKPAVVTRTRRRSASRPAGPPATVPVSDAPVDGAPAGSLAAAEPSHDPALHVPVKRKGGTRKR